MSLAQIRDDFDVPARIHGRILFAGSPAVITGSAGPYLRARLLTDSPNVPAGSQVRLHPTRVDYLDEAICNHCGEKAVPAGTLGQTATSHDGTDGWLHANGEARCGSFVTVDAPEVNWPAADTTAADSDGADVIDLKEAA